MRISDWSSDVCSSDLRHSAVSRSLVLGKDETRSANAPDGSRQASDRPASRADTVEGRMSTPDLSTPRGSQAITIKIRLRDKHASELTRQARAVKLVWTYVTETRAFAWRRDLRWLPAFDLARKTVVAG